MFAPLCILAIAISAILLSKLETIKAAEHWTSDWRTVWFSDRKDTQDESVALVLITEETRASPRSSPNLSAKMLSRIRAGSRGSCLRATAARRSTSSMRRICSDRPKMPNRCSRD
jgi:hypothetical protein